jgi:hypothetical protein
VQKPFTVAPAIIPRVFILCEVCEKKREVPQVSSVGVVPKHGRFVYQCIFRDKPTTHDKLSR